MSDAIAFSRKSFRNPQDNIPQSKQMRERILQVIREYVERVRPVGPLSIEELRVHTNAIIKIADVPEKYFNFISVLINNEVWRDTVACIPYEKRLFLMAKCLRSHEHCPADFDELGLLCRGCGRCVIDELKRQAEQLGYAVLIAEGSPIVMSLIETGQIEAVVGISCLSVLEEIFPYMEAGAVPGIAIPLLYDGCKNTSVDIDWVMEAIYLTAEDKSQRLNLETLHNQVNDWFTQESLADIFGNKSGDQTKKLALEWLGKAGKRWRPFLAVCTYKALSMDKDIICLGDLKKIAVAVECFHKASLIHDDIEDGDAVRYDEKTVHEEYGIPIALNIGDYLLGQGYRLLTELEVSAEKKAELILVASEGHCNLCMGQGMELFWLHNRKPLSTDEVLEIFSKKTAPAFEVALKMGAIMSGCGNELNDVLQNYSKSLGIAYQIRDDLDDLISTSTTSYRLCNRPSILMALAYELACDNNKNTLKAAWNDSVNSQVEMKKILDIFQEYEIEKRVIKLNECYKSKAIGSLIPIKNINLKSLLRRVLSKIFNDFENMGCCDDHQVRNALRRRQSEKSSG
jgi:geranylgeranyl diphosphate synthase, type II